jgi:transcription termination/antitermination protein NusG
MSSLPANTWFVVQVVPQFETRVASILESKGYQRFAPTYPSRRQWSDRVKTLQKPLFPGYVFVQIPGLNISGLLCSTPGVVRLLSFGGRPSPVPDSEIDAIRRLTALGKPLPTRYLSLGQKVEIKDGPFAGIVGMVKQIRNRACLVISVQLISQSIYVDVEECQISPVPATNRESRASAGGTV